jgi:dipeptidyl aminopeptidase/acylaminoacyl peptidase
VHGDADPTVNVTQSRLMVEAMKKAGADVKYTEVPGGNHVSVVVPEFEPMFEFFDQHIKK